MRREFQGSGNADYFAWTQDQADSLMKWTGSGDPTPFYRFSPGTDVAQTSVYDDGGGDVLLYVDFRTYSTGNQDVYSFTNP